MGVCCLVVLLVFDCRILRCVFLVCLCGGCVFFFVCFCVWCLCGFSFRWVLVYVFVLVVLFFSPSVFLSKRFSGGRSNCIIGPNAAGKTSSSGTSVTLYCLRSMLNP